MKIQRRWKYYVYCDLREKNLCTAIENTYEESVRKDGSIDKTIVIEYEDTDEVKAAIHEAFKSRGLTRDAKPATVTKEVKAEEVKAATVEPTEIKEEPVMNMITLTVNELNALLSAARANVVPATSQTIYRDREIVPADYEQLKRDLETARKSSATWQSKAADLEKQIAELKAQIGASVQTVAATSFVTETSAAAPAVPAPVANPAPATSAPVANPVLEEMEKKAAEFAAKKKREKEEEKSCEDILKKAGFDGLSINRLHKRTLPEAAFVAVCKSFGAEKTAEACLYVVRNENGEFDPSTIDLFERFSILPF